MASIGLWFAVRRAACLAAAVSLLACAATAGRSRADESSSYVPTAAVESALENAGENRAQLMRALQDCGAERREGMEFLIAHMPARDLSTLQAEFLLENVEYAYRAWSEAPWAKAASKEIFLNEVLPYVNIDERRDAWRKNFYERFAPLVKDCKTPGEAAQTLNRKVFEQCRVRYSKNRAKAEQSPFETIEAGLASCTGLSILLVDACRAVGVPARVAGTPMWIDESGNHTWVEVWDGTWHFTGAAEPADTLDRAWFVNRAAHAKRDPPKHAIYAVSYQRTSLNFPLNWNRRQNYVYAVDVTDKYVRWGRPIKDDQTRLLLRVVAQDGGARIAARVRVVAPTDGAAAFEGVAKDERFDANDDLAVDLARDREYLLEIRAGDRFVRKAVKTEGAEQKCTVAMSTGQEVQPRWRKLSRQDAERATSEEGMAVTGYALKLLRAGDGIEKPTEPSAVQALLRERPELVRTILRQAYTDGPEREAFAADFAADRVTAGGHTSPYVARHVGAMPSDGWPLFIAMHGGGGVPKKVNDSQWRVMQSYYKDQDSVEGYSYLALRAPTDRWNGFYDEYMIPLIERLIRQFVLIGNVDPNKVYLMGYSHGGYGAFYMGTKLADRFAAVHVSAAAPTGNESSAKNLRNTPFTFMVGEHDTNHGRLSRCQEFNRLVDEVRGNRSGVYPVVFEYQAGFGHGGLPDRDKIKSMYPATRNAVPQDIVWEPTDGLVKSFSWLHVARPKPRTLLQASCHDNVVTIRSSGIEELEIMLDERLVDYSKPVTVDLNGKRSVHELRPSLETLVATLVERGDPELAFSSRLVLKAADVTAEKE